MFVKFLCLSSVNRLHMYNISENRENHLIDVKVLIFFLIVDSQGSQPPPSAHLGTNISNVRQNLTIDTGAKIVWCSISANNG